MEEPNKSRILNSLYILSKDTDCSEALLVYLVQERVLIRQDVEVITNKQLSFDKAHALYDILLKRPGSFNPLIEGLKETHQIGVIETLKKSSVKPVPEPPVVPPSKPEPPTSPTTHFPPPLRRRSSTNSKHINVDLSLIHKTLFRCHAKRKALMLTLFTLDDAKEYLVSICDNYCDANHLVYDYIVRIDVDDKKKMAEELLRIADQYQVAVHDTLRVNLTSRLSESDCKAMINQICQSLTGQKCIFIFENIKQREVPLISSVLTAMQDGFIPTLITSPAMDWRNFGLDAEVMEFTEQGKLLKRSSRGNSFGNGLIGKVGKMYK